MPGPSASTGWTPRVGWGWAASMQRRSFGRWRGILSYRWATPGCRGRSRSRTDDGGAMTQRRRSKFKIVVSALVLLAVGAGSWLGGQAYLARMRDEAARAREDARKPTALLALRADEDARLHAGPMPIEEAMRTLATRGRAGLGS